MEKSESKPKLKLVGEDGNAYAIMGAAQKAAKLAGWDKERIEALLKEARSGNYNHLISVMTKHFDVF